MELIQAGDQYLLEFEIKEDNIPVVPSEISDLRIQVGNNLKSYSEGKILYENEKWYYPLKQQETITYDGHLLDVQVGIKKENIIHYSPVIQALFNKSIIKEVW